MNRISNAAFFYKENEKRDFMIELNFEIQQMSFIPPSHLWNSNK